MSVRVPQSGEVRGCADVSPEAAEYPSKYETDVLLKDGSRILLRPVRRDDAEAWLAFLNGLSRHTLYLRYHHVPKKMAAEDAIRACTVDYSNTFALVAEVLEDDRREIVAVGNYYRLPGKQSAEIAFTIADGYRGKGIGTRLLEGLANVARDNGIGVFEGDVLAENREMMTVLRDYGFHIASELEAGVYHVTFPIAPTRTVLRREEERERVSTLASLHSLLRPRSVAVIGASRRVGSIGHAIFSSLIRSEFSGVVYPVNPNAETVMSVRTYPSVLDTPGDVDLAIIVVPAELVSRVTDECGRKGVRAVVVISDGFRERGPEGAARERELRALTLGHGMRLVGPNCMGVINTDPAISMNATFSGVYPPRGNVAFLSQSGAMGLVILEHAQELNMGISTFVSVGNRADISANDLLQYWEQDPATDVILLYLESFGNPRKFGRIARRVSARKPIVAVKSGSTLAGSRAASSHTGALATSEVASEALFRQAGITRVNSVEELFDVATLLSNQPVPAGRRLAIVTNGGGPGIIAADAAEQQGLELPQLSPQAVGKLRAVVKRDLTFNNPLDLTAGAGADEFEGVLKVLAKDEGIDAVLAIFISLVGVAPKAADDAIRKASTVFRRYKKPLLTCSMGRRGVQGGGGPGGRSVPVFRFPEAAVSALEQAVRYGERTRQPTGTIPRFRGIKRSRARKVVEGATMRSSPGPIWLSAQEISLLLECYGIHMVQTLLAETSDDAAAQSAKVGFPVVVKLNSSTITHKTEVGGVVTDLKSEEEVKRAFSDIRARLVAASREKEMEGVVVQPFVKGGVEAIAGVTQDPSFGPLMMFGLGGIHAELLKDVAVRLHPLTNLDARALIGSVKMAKLLEGYRGSPPADTGALEELLLRLSALVEDVPEIAELDFNPVMVMPRGQGYRVVDARVLVT